MKKILVTGASGFIGKSLCNTLLKLDKPVIGVVRSLNSSLANSEIKYHSLGDISQRTNWKDILSGVDCVIHCAAKAHVINNKKKNSLVCFQLINSLGTKNLAEQAAETGVRRLIFLSSIGVDKLNININNPLLNSNKLNVTENYLISKYEAEHTLMGISNKTDLQVVIIRLPLVYGRFAPGNLKRLIRLVRSGIPLPFDGIKNKRSFIGIDNLVNLLIHCIDHPEAIGKTFLASDGEDLSTPELIKLIASSMGKKAHMFSMPTFVLKFLGIILGKKNDIKKLVGSLRIDNSYTKEILNWTPPVSVKEGIRRMVQEK